jgi:hypothetical protein
VDRVPQYKPSPASDGDVAARKVVSASDTPPSSLESLRCSLYELILHKTCEEFRLSKGLQLRRTRKGRLLV